MNKFNELFGRKKSFFFVKSSIVLFASSEMIKHVVGLLLANFATYFKVLKQNTVWSLGNLPSLTKYVTVLLRADVATSLMENGKKFKKKLQLQ